MGSIQRKHLLGMAVALLVAGGLFALVGWPSGEDKVARPLDEEPQITLLIAETGERRRMPVEEYIQGVVAAEMYADWPIEAYAAQAILARSFTMDFLSKGGLGQSGADISNDVERAQAYRAENITPDIKKAVEMTRGEVMTYEDRYISAWFHSYSGGRTASAKEGLAWQEEEPPYIKSVVVPDNEFVPEDLRAWKVEFPLEQVQRALADRGVRGPIQGINIVEKGATGRIVKVEIEGPEGDRVTMDGTAFRLALGSEEMKSTLVNRLEIEGDQLVIEGRGYGHGVGLSQWDAYMLAKEGKSPEEIVQFFFKDIEIKKLWD
ncbi:MAG: SpoIID/LytB domain-containing protein [Limnochordia bacterium]